MGPGDRCVPDARLGIEIERRSQCPGQGAGVTRGCQPAGHALADGFAGGAGIGSDDWNAHGLRLDGDTTETLGNEGGLRDDVGEAVGCRHVVTAVDERYPPLESGLENAVLDFPSQCGTGAGHTHHQAHGVTAQLLEGVDHDMVALEPCQAPGKHDDGNAVRQVPVVRQGGDAVDAHGRRVEPRHVDTAEDAAQPVLRHAILLAHVAGHVFGDGDHPVASRHHGVVEPLGPGVDGVGCMESGHDRRSRAPRGGQYRPGGRPGTHVDHVDLMDADQVDKTQCVEGDGQGILGGDGHRHVNGLGVQQIRHEFAPLGGDEGLHAGVVECPGDIDDGPFGATDLESRNDLENDKRVVLMLNHDIGTPAACTKQP